MTDRKTVTDLKNCTFKIVKESKTIGSCFSIFNTSYLATCHHVLYDKSGNLRPNLRLVDHNNNEYQFNVKISDYSSDIALIQAIGFSFNQGLELGNYSNIEEGDTVFFSGFPFGLNYHVTHKGMVSAKTIINGRESIQLDASVNKGNSGGPCIYIDSNQKIFVVGIVATRLVSIDFKKLSTLHQAYESNINYKGRNHTSTGVIRSLVGLFKILVEELGNVFSQFDRYLNVGFGEAISVDYLKNAINVQSKKSNT